MDMFVCKCKRELRDRKVEYGFTDGIPTDNMIFKSLDAYENNILTISNNCFFRDICNIIAIFDNI